MITLRPYQEEAVAAVEQAIARGVTRPLVQLPTGTGKTIVFAELIRRLGEPALVIAHRDELLQQAADKIRMVNPQAWIGLVKAQADERDHPVVVASVQTLSRQARLDRMPGDYRLVVIDEAHHATADSYRRVMARWPDTPIVGVTATPERSDGGLDGVWQELVYSRDLQWAIRDGYLADLRALRVTLSGFNPHQLRVRGGDFLDGEAGRALSDAGAPAYAVRAYREHADGRKALVFTPTVQLAHEMAGAFDRGGVTAEAVDGSTPADERRAIFRRFAAGDTRVLANCGIATEGYDEPSVDCVILARPTMSRVLLAQMVGRGTRLHPGKQDCLVIDLAGATDRTGLVTVPDLFGATVKQRMNGGGSSVLAAIEQAAAAVQEALALDARPVELFRPAGGARLAWVALPDGRYAVGVGTGTLTLADADGKWKVEHVTGRESVTVADGLDLGYAQGAAEDYARRLGATVLANPDAPWRTLPATDKQLALLAQLGAEAADGLTRGQASDLITRAKISRPTPAISRK